MTSIKDVAASVGVSTATVSRALRGLPRVSDETRVRVLKAAAASTPRIPSGRARAPSNHLP